MLLPCWASAALLCWVIWQPWLDLNHQPAASEADALSVELQGCCGGSVRLDSHQHLPGYEPDALTVKLQTKVALISA